MLNSVNYYFLFLTVLLGAGVRTSEGQQRNCERNPALGNSASWKCVDRASCTLASTLPAKQTVNCGQGKICCPERQPTTSGERNKPNASPQAIAFAKANRVALDKCYEYAAYRYDNYTIPAHILYDPPINKYVMKCANIETLIVGGKDSLPMELPHMALLGYDDDVTSEDGWRCGGSLISNRFILSAAHCTKTSSGEKVKWAMLGLLSKSEITEDKIGTNIFRITDHINHPQYKVGKSVHENDDIALFMLEKAIELSPLIRPICIHYESPMAINTSVIISGWGKLIAGGVESDSLQKAVVHNLDWNQCVKVYKNDAAFRKGFDRKTMICGGHPDKEIDTCNGDSGGPMQIPKPGMNCTMIQVGITSRGPKYCGGNVPAIYTRVSAYLPWIKSIVWPENENSKVR